MSDFVEVERRSFFGRIKNSVGGALFGVVFLLLGVGGLFWNEGRALKREKDLKEGAGAVVSIDSASVDPANEGRLVHLTGETRTAAPLVDVTFGVSATGVKLIRDVEMYQWVEEVQSETKDKVGGGSETVKRYSYDKKWRRDPVNSDSFKVRNGHQNPEMKYRSATSLAKDATLGAFSLPNSIVSQIRGAEPLEVTSLEGIDGAARDKAKAHNGGIYLGLSPALPAIGDYRIRFEVVPNGALSVVARQSGSSLDSYKTRSGGGIELVERGILAAAEMFQLAHQRNKTLTWAIRAGGFVVLGVAFSLILGPISAFSSVIPFLGRLARTGIGIVGFFLAGILSSMTIGLAWIFYRPVLGISLLVITIGLMVFLALLVRRRSAAGTPPPLSAVPPPLT